TSLLAPIRCTGRATRRPRGTRQPSTCRSDGAPKFRRRCRPTVVRQRNASASGAAGTTAAVAFELLRLATMDLRHEESDWPSEHVPEQILPAQFAELVQRSAERTPELRLMAAVLEDAIRTFCRSFGSRGVRHQRLFRETANWFESSDVSWPFSFENISDALGLEPGWLRGLLHRRCS